MLTIDLDVAAGDWPRIDWQVLADRAVSEAQRQAGIPLRQGAEVSVLLTDDETVRALNREWRGIDRPTNVLSFQSVPVHRLAAAPALGDIVLACETVRREAGQENKRFEDHVAHLLVHGFLHLIGHDHENPADAEAMEALERDILAALGIGDPYADSDLWEARPA